MRTARCAPRRARRRAPRARSTRRSATTRSRSRRSTRAARRAKPATRRPRPATAPARSPRCARRSTPASATSRAFWRAPSSTRCAAPPSSRRSWSAPPPPPARRAFPGNAPARLPIQPWSERGTTMATRPHLSAAFALAALGALAAAQTEIHTLQLPSLQAGTHRYGSTTAVVGDLNNDGVPDILVGDPNDDTDGPHVGSARVISGKDFTVLQHFVGKQVNADFGTSVAKIGDVDGDGVPDLVIGAPGMAGIIGPDAGEVDCFSGKTGIFLWGALGGSPGERFGFSVSGAGGDVNGDGVPDVIAGAPHYDSAT